ncbi:MAG: hypothetical protein ABI076_10940 [Acidobacteriaceae bacterium]
MRREAAQKRTPQKIPASGTPAAGTVEYARTCHRHMAGWFGVAITDALEKREILVVEDAHSYRVTPVGIRWFETSMGIVVPTPVSSPKSSQNKIAVRCLDGTERRPHLAGWLGRALYQRFLERKWVLPIQGSRALRVTSQGKTQLGKLLGLPPA